MAEDPNTLMLFIRLALSFGTVLALVGGLTWVLRRRGLLRHGATSPSGRLEVLDRKALGKSTSLVVARVGDRAMLLGVTNERIELLSDAPGLDAAWRAQQADAADEDLSTHTPRTAVHTRPSGTHRTGGARRTGHPRTAPAVDRTRMSFVEALQELTVRRS